MGKSSFLVVKLARNSAPKKYLHMPMLWHTKGLLALSKVTEPLERSIQGSDKPVGSSLNDACAGTSFALSDAELVDQDTDAMIHDSGNKKSNDRQNIGAFAHFICCIDDHEQLSSLARLIVDP
jgi:hypothetical protein